MNYNYFILLATLLLLPVTSVLALPPASDNDFEKTYSQTFAVNGQGTVNLTNRYGKIDVETWDRNEVKIDVRVRVTADSEEDADRVFDRIEIVFAESSNTASATTRIGGRNGRSAKGWLSKLIDGDYFIWDGSSSNDYRIDYRVRMPAAADLMTDARYCDVSLPDLSGEVNAKVAYGNLAAGRLSGRCEIRGSYGNVRADQLGPGSTFHVRYSDNNKLGRVADLRYDGRYSETEIEQADRLIVDAGYEELDVRTVNEIRLDGNYNDFSIEEAGRIEFDGSYTDLEIGLVRSEVEIHTSYGDVDIDRLHENYRRVYIRATYADVQLTAASLDGSDVELRTRYGDIDLDVGPAGRENSLSLDSAGSSESVLGRIPGKAKGGRIDISTTYGDISIDLD